MPDTRIAPAHMRVGGSFGGRSGLVVLALLTLLAFGAMGCASTAPRGAASAAASLVWAQGDRAYVTLRDSLDARAIEPGARVSFESRGRAIAAGAIERVVDDRLASVRVTSGSIASVARLDRVRVSVERKSVAAGDTPPPIDTRDPATQPASTSLLRIGCPAGVRANLAVPCDTPALNLAFAPVPYRAESLGVHAFRLVRTSDRAAAGAWPDTLMVQRFAEAADEEIAFERGELDLAVFWPGELSPRMRRESPDHRLELGLRARGVIATRGPVIGPIDPEIEALNAQMFGGELLPWRYLAGDSVRQIEGDDIALPPIVTPARYTVDAAMPGQRVLERYLNRNPVASSPARIRKIELAYFDTPLAGRDSLEAQWRTRGTVPQYAILCPVLFGARHAELMARLDADAFANLVGCGSTGRRP